MGIWRSLSLTVVLLLLTLIPFGVLRAETAQDQLKLSNGDVLSGTFVKFEDEKIHFESPLLGLVILPQNDARLMRADGTYLDPEKPAEDTTAEKSVPPDEIPVTDPDYTPGTEEIRSPPWRGRLEFGFMLQSGRTDRSEITARAQTSRQISINNYRFQGELVYGKTNQVRSNDSYFTSFRWRRDVSERFFSQTHTRHMIDRVRDVRNRLENDLGIGFKYTDRPYLRGSVGAGLSVQYREGRGISDRTSYLSNAFQDLEWRINDRYRFEEEISILVDPSDTEDHIVRVSTALIGAITQKINITMRYQFLYEGLTSPGVEKIDQRFVTSLGYNF